MNPRSVKFDCNLLGNILGQSSHHMFSLPAGMLARHTCRQQMPQSEMGQIVFCPWTVKKHGARGIVDARRYIIASSRCQGAKAPSFHATLCLAMLDEYAVLYTSVMRSANESAIPAMSVSHLIEDSSFKFTAHIPIVPIPLLREEVSTCAPLSWTSACRELPQRHRRRRQYHRH